jgi:hypothetical protein
VPDDATRERIQALGKAVAEFAQRLQ